MGYIYSKMLIFNYLQVVSDNSLKKHTDTIFKTKRVFPILVGKQPLIGVLC
jgi:hypothetical protein